MWYRPFACLVAAACAFGCGTPAEPEARTAIEGLSAAGYFDGHFELLPNPPVVGNNELRASLFLGSEPLVGARLVAVPSMPVHGHGSPVAPEVSEIDSGVYRIERINYFMPGDWELRIDVETEGVSDRFAFTFAVQ